MDSAGLAIIPSTLHPPASAPRAQVLHPLTSLQGYKDLDLDRIFGGSATDVEEEDEEHAVTTSSGSHYTNTLTPTKSMLRSHLPEDLSDQIVDYYKSLPEELHEESQKEFAWFLSRANVEWDYMSTASRCIKSLGEYKRKYLAAADRSCDWFWENGRPLDTRHPPAVSVASSVPVASSKIEPPFHHLSFLGHPVYCKSSTPAAVSFWRAFTTHQVVFPPFSRRGVINSQATKLIDPFVYLGDPEFKDIEEFSGTSLFNAVVGRVEKAYADYGTWQDDIPDEYDEVLRLVEWDDPNVYRPWHFTCEQQLPHEVSLDDDGDTIINDGKGSYTPKPTRRNPDEEYVYTPSKLRTVEFAYHASVEVEPSTSAQPSEEDSDAAETKAGHEAPNDISGQEIVACDSAENQTDTSGDIEMGEADTSSDVEMGEADYEAESSSSVPQVATILTAAPESSSDGSEETESPPPSSPLSGDSISTKSSLSSGSVAEKDVKEADTFPTLSTEAVFLPAEQPSLDYPELFAACDHLNKLAADQAAVLEAASVGLRALMPFRGLNFQFQPPSDEDEEEVLSEDEGEDEEEDTVYTPPTVPSQPQVNDHLAPKILPGDFLDQVPSEPELPYGPIAIAVGHTAFRIAGWLSSRLW